MTRDPLDNFWFRPLGRSTAAGVAVTLESALRAPVVYNCLNVISQTISSLPIAVFERLPQGNRRKVDDHPLIAVFNNPDGESNRHEFVQQMLWDLAGAGNALFKITAGTRGVTGLRRMDPARTLVERLPDGSRRWTVTWVNGAQERLVEGEVWHIRVPPLIDQLVGTSQIAVGAEAIGALLALQEYGAAYFENDATPPVVLEHPGHFKDQASRTNYLDAVAQFFGRKRKGPAVIEYGMKVTKLGTTPEESQFLETRKELQGEIARIWRMPPHKVGIMDRATFSNIEHQALEFVTDTLTPWIELVEQAVDHALMLRPDRYFFEFNVAGLLRGDIKARFEAYAQARNWGWLSVNEIRRLENMNPIGARGDQYLQPLNMTPAGAESTQAAVFGPRGEVVSRRIGGEWTGGAHGA